MSFHMKILNVFHLSNGRTVLTGLIDGHPGFIGKTVCSLRYGDRVLQGIDIEGEQVLKKTAPNDHRALASVNAIPLTSEEARSGCCYLDCVE